MNIKNLLRIIFILLFILCGYIFRFFFSVRYSLFFVNWHFMEKNGPSAHTARFEHTLSLSVTEKYANGKHINVKKLFIVTNNEKKRTELKKEIQRTIKSFVLFMWCTHHVRYKKRKKMIRVVWKWKVHCVLFE